MLDQCRSWGRRLPDGRSVPRHGWHKRHFWVMIFFWSFLFGIVLLTTLGAGHTLIGQPIRSETWSHFAMEIGAIALLAIAASIPTFSRRTRASYASLGIAAGAALFVHLTSGLIEAHFMFLVGIALISLYHDWLPLALGVALTVVHHMTVGLIDPTSVYNHPAALANPVSWAFLHGFFLSGVVVAEVLHWRLMDQQRHEADRVTASADEGIVGLDDAGHVTYINPAAEQMLGRRDAISHQPAAKVFGQRIPELLGPLDETLSGHDDVVRSGRGVRVTDPDGSTRYIDWRSVPLMEHEGAVGAVVTLRDVTERQVAEMRLREKELQLSTAQRIANMGSFEWAPVADVLRVSSEFMRILEAADPEPSRPIERLADLLERVHEADRAAVYDRFLEAHDQEHRFSIECRIGSGDLVRYCELRGQLDVRYGQDGPQRLVRGSCTDVTERVNAEAMRRRAEEKDREIALLRQQDAFKNQFINAVAHELNTPLTPVRLQLHVLKMDPGNRMDARQKRAVHLLERNVQRFSSLVEDLLDAARLEGGRLRMDPTPMTLDSVVDEAVDHFEGVMLERDLCLETDIDGDVWVEADRERLIQVVYNLLSNACKFTPSGGTVEVGVRSHDDEAVVTVSDTGIGISQADQERLFKPFSQLRDHMENTESGTGLGLYISRGLIELQGGRIWCESEGTGKGATFGFTLPLAASGGNDRRHRTAGRERDPREPEEAAQPPHEGLVSLAY